MPVLNNPRHELFSQELAKGNSAVDAYEAAGFRRSRQNAHALLQKPYISGRVTALLAQREKMETEATAKATEALALDKTWILSRLKENAERALQAVPVLDAKGTPTGEYRYEGSVANRALELLGKEFGMFKEKMTVAGNISLEALVMQSLQVPDTS